MNGFFVVLHLVQTHLWYDGLAQDVSIWECAGVGGGDAGVGAADGQPAPGAVLRQEDRLPRRLTEVARRYHGYYFVWAIVYTFWYHPLEATGGHLIGFLYMFLLLLQGSLLFTRAHVSRWWTLVLEVSVLAYGMLAAVMQGNGIWPMFAFGFGGIFVVTQMHGLG